jgi:cytochrome P450
MTAAVRPQGPKGKPMVGSLFEFRRDPIGFLTTLAQTYGDIVHFKLGSQDVFLLNHPDYIRDVLVTNSRQFHKSRGLEIARRFLGNGLLTSEDEFHRRQRRLVQPAFHRDRIAAYGGVMADYSARLAQRWQDGATVDMAQEMMRLTLSIVAKTLFDADVEAEAREIGQALTDVMQVFRRVTMPFSDVVDRLPLPSNRRFRRARERLDATIYRIIHEHRARGTDRGDLLSMLLLAQDEEENSGGMTDLQVRDEAMTLFLAGHETTANALTWSWYLLSQNPDAETRLHEELDAVLKGRLPTLDHVPGLRYTEMVFSEAMRLYPPAWAIGRRAMSPYQVGEYLLPERAIVLMSQFVMHHDPRFFPDPNRFDPDRWTPEAQAARPKFSYFPFGGGPRVCIGESFAWLEGVLVLATLAQKWSMRLVPGHPVEIQPLITLRPKHGMRMNLRRLTIDD